jgi:hypothetical protein
MKLPLLIYTKFSRLPFVILIARLSGRNEIYFAWNLAASSSKFSAIFSSAFTSLSQNFIPITDIIAAKATAHNVNTKNTISKDGFIPLKIWWRRADFPAPRLRLSGTKQMLFLKN